MGRALKYHEQKLLKKVDLLEWRKENNVHEIKVIRRYRIPDREQYHKYNRLVGHISRVVSRLKKRPVTDPYRIQTTTTLLEKLYHLGLIQTTKSLLKAEEVTVSAFCRRRLPVVLVRVNMAESLKEATTFVEQGHVRVGPTVVTDPAFLVTRSMEDFVTWVDSSKIKRTIMKYNDKLDDYDLLGN
uniref:U3 small nucleolar ribonucleoprotein protein IMP3 n=1 Tax=Peronospora matthiolae TaxID=2874970 RepID=A0AAV1URN7_9STRA